MQIQPKPPVGAGASTTVQDVAAVSSKDGAQGLKVQTTAVDKPAVASSSQVDTGKSPEQQLKDALVKLNNTVQKTQPQLEFSVDEETDLHVVKLIDKDNGEIIRQFPSKEAIELAKSIDRYTGMLIKAKS